VSGAPNHAAYIKCMEEIKRRLCAIDDILSGKVKTSFNYTNIEFVALQFRKIFELIVLATLASHEHYFEGLTRKLSKEWQVSKVVAIVSERNPDFFPKPIIREKSVEQEVIDNWIDVTEGFLTLDELIQAHGHIGGLMHADNPLRESARLEELEAQFPIWRARLVRLLNDHLIKFPDDRTVLYVGMQSAETGGVHVALFSKL
jgi:hypothetical protein